MTKDYSALNFSEKERICESIFINNGPYWHIYTDGTRMQNIFCCEKDFITGMWALAASLHLSKKARALTFELMGNHMHLIIAGQKENCIEAFDLFAARLRKTFPKRERAIDWSQFKVDILPIESLQALRNEIIYVNRNAFVANPEYTPDSYPWGGGCAYFCPWLKHINTSLFGEKPTLTQRAILHTRDVAPFADLKAIGSMPFIPSFCDIKLGESMFRDARSYFNSLTRNAEASNQQLRRMLRMDLAILEEMFP